MSFISGSHLRNVLITGVTQAEYDEMYHRCDEDMQLLDFPILFPSRRGEEYATMLISAGMGCGDGRWEHEYLPRIQQMYPGRIVYSGEFETHLP